MEVFKAKLILYFLCLIIYIVGIHGFIPNQSQKFKSLPSTRGSITHTQMTERAHQKMAVHFMNEFPSEYPDQVAAMSTSDFILAANDFKKGVENPDFGSSKDDPGTHVYSETFNDSISKLAKYKTDIFSAVQSTDEAMIYARELTGALFHTLQDFYSHSNWIEKRMGRAEVNPGWGNSGIIGPVAGVSDATCTDNCSSSTTRCVGNVILPGALTSGYMETKPLGGKCSHGGPIDITKDVPPIGGINKDTRSRELSPHDYFHLRAARAAEADTLRWLVTLRRMVTDEKFAHYLGLEPASTLCFVIDRTGSMIEDLVAVKNITIALTQDASKTRIGNFVLATFSDPDLPTLLRTNNSTEMVAAIDSINPVPGDGGDFEELTYGGMLLGLYATRPGSVCYVFTDATAKDDNKSGLVESSALTKNVQIFTFYTGAPPPVDISNEPLVRTALLTGGQMMIVTKEELAEAVQFIDTGLSGTQVNIYISDTGTPSRTYSIPIDETLTDVVFTISTSGVINSVTFTDPAGLPQFPSIVVSVPSLAVLKFQAPSAGVWVVIVDASDTHSLRVTANSLVAFTYTFVEEHLDGHLGYSQVEGKPAFGDSGLIVIEPIGGYSPVRGKRIVPGLADMASLQFRRSNGLQLRTYLLTELRHLKRYVTNVTLPGEDFRVAFVGKDSSGNQLQRFSPTLQTKSTSTLSMLGFTDASNAITAGTSKDIFFSITNSGDASNFSLKVSDSLGYVESINLASVFLDSGDTETFYVRFTIPADAEFGKVSLVSVTSLRSGSSDDGNYFVFHVSVGSLSDDISPPVCTITSSNGDCSLTRSGGNCKDETWSFDFSVKDTNIGLLVVKPSILHPGASLDVSFPIGTTDTVSGTYTSDCCLPHIAIISTDLLGNSDNGDMCSVAHFGMCSMSTSGSITTFDGASGSSALELPVGIKTWVSGTTTPDTDICKYRVTATADADGFIDWLAICVGVDSDPKSYKQSFIFNRKTQNVEIHRIRRRPIVLSLPYTWTHGGLTIQITGDHTGWHLSSSPCSYSLYFGPDGPEAVFRLSVGGELMDKVGGVCGDFDGSPSNDYF